MKHLKKELVTAKSPHSHGAHAEDLRQQMVPALGMLVPSYADTPLIKFNLHRKHQNELITAVSSKSGSQRGVHTCHSSTWRLRLENWEFQASMGYSEALSKKIY